MSNKSALWLVYLGEDYVGSYYGTEQEAIEYFNFSDEERLRVNVVEDDGCSEFNERG